MKSMQQMNDHIPSDLIPLHDDMIISFVNYELRVRLDQKTKDEIATQQQKMNEFFENKYNLYGKQYEESENPKVVGTSQIQEPVNESAPNYTAEVQQNSEPIPDTAGAASNAEPAQEENKSEAVPAES